MRCSARAERSRARRAGAIGSGQPSSKYTTSPLPTPPMDGRLSGPATCAKFPSLRCTPRTRAVSVESPGNTREPVAKSSRLRVAAVQMPAVEQREINVQQAVAGIRSAAEQGAELVCLQELIATPYFCQVEEAKRFDLAEPVDGPTNRAIAAAAREARVCVLSSFFERRAAGVYHNTAVLFGADGEALGMYRKMHIPDDPQYYEKFYFTPGDL